MATSLRKQYTTEGLLEAAKNGKFSELREHVQNGVDVNGKFTLDGYTALHWACIAGHVSIIQFLLDNEADISATDNDLNTPLHLAVRWAESEVFLLLLKNGADIDMKNNSNLTPLEIARNCGNNKVAHIMDSFSQKRRARLAASLQKSLNIAKSQHGKVPVRFIKILLTGSGAAGKTSFSKLLMKKKINTEHHSTNIVQSKHAISIKKAEAGISVKKAVMVESQNQNVVWIEMDDHSQITHLRQALLNLNVSDYKQQKSHTKNALPHVKTTEISDKQHNTTDTSTKKSLIKQKRRKSIIRHFSNPFQSSVKSDKLSSFSTLVDNSIDAQTNSEISLTHDPGDVLNIITILDTGGQPEYIHLLPTVNIHPMITFIVHDLSKCLDDQALVEYSENGKHIFEPYHLKYSNLDMIKFLMSSINDSLERPSTQIPQMDTDVSGTTSYLCCVGTHADKVCQAEIHKMDVKLTDMVYNYGCKAAVWQNMNNGVLFSVDNTTAGDYYREDPTAALIRNKIEVLSSDKGVYELPITWMLMELEIRQVCTIRGEAYISFQECVSIASKSKLITDVEQVRYALLYYHLLGVLLYYPEVAGLCDYIIIDHQWLFNRLSQIVCFTFKPSSSLQAATKLKCSGILSMELLKELQWKGELKEEYFISLLVVMKIIAPLPREDGDGEDYFIPYVLPTYNNRPLNDDILPKYGCLQGEPLLIQFISNLLPRGFFCCLIVQILQRLPSGWNHLITEKENHHSYSNLMTFQLPHAYFLSLIDKLSYLEVQIHHKEEYYYKKCPIHISVRDVLATALENVCEQLNFNRGRLQYGFHCQCKELEEHIAILTTLSPPFDYARCRYGKITSTTLQHSHTIWLMETEAENFTKADNSVIKSEIATDNCNEQHHQSKECKIFQDYYSKLKECLPASELSHYLVSNRVISLADNEEITKPTTLSLRAAEIVLTRVDNSLQNGDVVPVHNLLHAMQKYGNVAIKGLCNEIKSQLPAHEESEDNQQGSCSVEFDVFIKYYSKLVNVLQVKNLLQYFVSEDVILVQDAENIIESTSPKRAAELLLMKISAPLQAGFTDCSAIFYIFLDVLKQHGNDVAVQLCCEIEETLQKKGSQNQDLITSTEKIDAN